MMSYILRIIRFLQRIIHPRFPIRRLHHWFQNKVARFWYFGCVSLLHPEKAFPQTCIGITGTNGKSSTVEFTRQILTDMGKKVLSAGTIAFWIGQKRIKNRSHKTSLGPYKLFAFLRQGVDAGCDTLLLEVSSHAIDQFRISGIPFSIRAITNITPEHLDYHPSFKHYTKTKEQWCDRGKTCITPQTQQRQDIQGKQIQAFPLGIEITYKNESKQIQTHLIGSFQVENILLALNIAKNADPERFDTLWKSGIEKTIASLTAVPWRMEIVSENVSQEKNLGVCIMDYAVTPDSYEKILTELRELRPEGKLFAVFGACGQRDRSKRPHLTRVAATLCDRVILTTEETYNEPLQQIFHDLEAGLNMISDTDKAKVTRITERRTAIQTAIQESSYKDTIILFGMWDQDTMILWNTLVPWVERDIIHELLTEAESKK